MKGYAILYKKVQIPDSNIWVLEPIKKVKVKYNYKVNQYILRDLVLSSIEDMRVMDDNETFFIGNYLDIRNKKKIKEYGVRSVSKVEDIIFERMQNLVIVGAYDQIDRKIYYRLVDLVRNKNDILNNFSYEGKTREEIIEALKNYEEMRNDYNGDITVISEKELDAIRNFNNVDDILYALHYILMSKETYFFKMEQMEKNFFILDEDMYDLLELTTKEEILNRLNNLIVQSDESKRSIIEEMQEGMAFSEISEELNEEFYNQVYTFENRTDAINVLKIYKQFFYLTEKQVRQLSKKAPKTLLYYKTVDQNLDEIIAIENLDDIKKELKKFYPKQMELLKQSEIYECAQKEEEMQKNKYKFDYNQVRDELVSKIIGRDIQIDRILTTIERNDKVENPSKRQAMIIAGPTGTGKTQTFYELRNALKNKRPVIIVDTNQLTQEGYVGGSIEENILEPLIMEAHNINKNNESDENASIVIDQDDIDLAQRGIIILDEIDKRAGKDGSVNTEGVINEILKLMDPGTVYQVPLSKMLQIPFETSYLTVFASGAFQEYFDTKESQSIGFTETSTKSLNNYTKYKEVDPMELVNYGLDRQFIGRFDKVTLYEPHTKDSLIELESNKTTSNLQVEIENYQKMGIDFVWEDGYIEEVVERAYKMRTGGRATKNIINRSLGSLNTEVNNHRDEIKTIFVPKISLDDSSKILLITKTNEPILLGKLMEETKKKNEELKKKEKISCDKNALEEAKEIIEKTKVLKK